MSTGGLTLHGGTREEEASPAILFRLNESLLQDVREAASGQGSLQFIGGKVPRIRLGKRTIDLTISDEAFRHELYSASLDSVHDLHFSALISHRAELKAPERKQSVGSDAALAALQNSLASYQRKKEANSTNITSSVLPAPRNRFDAARKQKQDARRGLLSSQDALGESSGARSGRGGPIQPTSAEEFAARQQAMRTPVIHLLAMGPMSREDIAAKTHVPRDGLDELLPRVGKQVDGGKWMLTERAFKDLDVYRFGYRSSDDRQAAIENAIKAYDKLRLGKDEKLWQMLLPEADRGKGTTLSKLNLNPAPSPNPAAELTVDGKLTPAANTPRMGPASTPKIGTKKAGGSTGLTKRILANDPKKARAAEDAKERKRKGKEAVTVTAAAAAASDMESSKPARKKQATKTNKVNYKSAAIVHSSDDESGEEGEVKESKPTAASKTANTIQPKAAVAERKTNAAASAKTNSKPATSKSPDASDGPVKAKSTVPKTGSLPGKPTPASALRASQSALHKSSPNGTPSTSAGASAKAQLSPEKPSIKPSTRPKVPSPLGAARPRVASDVSDRGAVGVQRVGLGITNGVRKRQDTVTSSTESIASTGSEKAKRELKAPADKAVKVTANGVHHKPALINGNGLKAEGGLKRKSDDPQEKSMAAKHRRTESSTSQASRMRAHASPVNGNGNGNGNIADPIFSGGNDNNSKNNNNEDSTILHNISYGQGLTLAQRFREDLYPKYVKIYDDQAAKEARGEKVSREDRDKLWKMHRRLEEIKMQIKAAAQREHLEG